MMLGSIDFLTLRPLWWLLLILPVAAVAYRWSLVDRPPGLMRGAFACRTVAVLLVLLALCRPFWKGEVDDVHTVFLVDVSESVDASGMRVALAAVRDARAELSTGDSSSLFGYAGGIRELDEAGLEALIDDVEAGRADAEFRSESALDDALLGARLAFPAQKSRRVVIYSDGAPTTPVDEALATLAQEETSVVFEKIAPLAKPEASVVGIEAATPVAFQGEIVRLNVELYANEAMTGRLRILHRGVAVGEQQVSLVGNEAKTVSLDVEMTTSGDAVWSAELIPERDHFPLNNQASTTVTVRGEPRVLAIHRDEKSLRPIRRSLAKQGISLEVRGENGLPRKLDEMLAFDAIVLADVAASDLDADQLKLLKSYVTDFGGGLAMLGSENSFGLGGYYKTPVEEVLPLVSRFEKEKQKPSLAMVLVIDKSGSMSGAPIQLARQAARSAAELLSARDMIGVVGFDGAPQLILEMTSAGNQNEIAGAIDSLQASGGTDLFPAMIQARDLLDETAAKIKHVIILTDGQTPQADHIGLTQEMADAGMTISAVAMGDGAARQLLESIAEAGGGRYYETNNPENVPQIFTRETMQASKSAIKEDVFAAVQIAEHPVLTGYEDAELPFVLGYVMTRPKPTSQVLISAETGDPLLAVSRFGLGHGLAWTSDLSEKWASEWLSWTGGGKFWAQVLRGILRKDTSAGLSIAGAVSDGEWKLDVSYRDAAGRPVNGVPWVAEALDEDGEKLAVQVRETGLGRSTVLVDVANAERVALRLHDPEGGAMKTVQWNRGYPAEYQLNADVPEVLANADGQAFAETKGTVRTSAVGLFGIAALIFLILGIVLRRI